MIFLRHIFLLCLHDYAARKSWISGLISGNFGFEPSFELWEKLARNSALHQVTPHFIRI